MKVEISFVTDIPQLGLDFIKSLPEDERTETLLRFLLNVSKYDKKTKLHSIRKQIKIDNEWV